MNSAAALSFGRAESFGLRYGWLSKGLDAVREDARVFSRESAAVRLGVGRNMAQSIRHWLLAARAVEAREGGLAVTELGEAAFGADGDPWLERDATLWLLHWLIAARPGAAGAVHWFFNRFHKTDFSSADAAEGLTAFAAAQGLSVSPRTLAADAGLVLRMYAPQERGPSLEDALDAPLAELKLVGRTGPRLWRSRPDARPRLAGAAFAFAVAEAFEAARAEQLPVEALLYGGAGRLSPGAVFRLTEDGLLEKLEALCAESPQALRLGRTAGVRQLHRIGPLPPLAVLRERFGGHP